MSEYVELKFQKISEDVYVVVCGFNKHMITIKNCDVLNTLMLFSILAFNKFVVKQACDIEFWEKFIMYIQKHRGIKKDIKFESVLQISLAANKSIESRLLYSGGKDSAYSHIKHPIHKLLQYRVQVYTPVDVIGVEIMTTNFDNELFHKDKRFMDVLKLELYLPIISNYRNIYMGIEKEIWEDGVGMLGYDLKEWKSILFSSGVYFDSPVKDLYSNEILNFLKEQRMPFDKCQAADKYVAGLHKNNFCYTCEKCLTYYLQGCNMKMHNFDSGSWEVVNNYNEPEDIIKHIKKQCNDNLVKAEYFIKMYHNFRGMEI